jgi:hypothetical protein
LSKPNYIDIDRSLVKPSELKYLKRLGYNGDESLIRFAGEEIVPESKENDIIVLKRASFGQAFGYRCI